MNALVRFLLVVFLDLLCVSLVVASISISTSTGDPHDATTPASMVDVSVDGLTEPFAHPQNSSHLDPEAASTNNATGIRRFRHSETVNYTEFLPCQDAVSPSVSQFMKDYRKTAREPPYSSLPCAPRECFRSIEDGYGHLLAEGTSIETITERVTDIIYQKGLVTRNSLKITLARQQTHFGQSRHSNVGEPYEALHADYMEVAGYVVTAVLYGEPSEHLQGGETCFVDSFTTTTRKTKDSDDARTNGKGDDNDHNNHDFTLREGVVIEPKKGRLVLFSGGGENVHGPLPIRRKDQERSSYILFFQCQDTQEDQPSAE